MTRVMIFPTYMVPSRFPAVLADFDLSPGKFRAMDAYLQSDLCRLMREAGKDEAEICRIAGISLVQLDRISGARNLHHVESFGLNEHQAKMAEIGLTAAHVSATPVHPSLSVRSEMLLRWLGESAETGLTIFDVQAMSGWHPMNVRKYLGALYKRDFVSRTPVGRDRRNTWRLTDAGRKMLSDITVPENV